jgi:4-amino-4-deoxy-L-arabinose transferase-like glycosyltransferase
MKLAASPQTATFASLRTASLQRTDVRNLALVLLGFVCLVVLIPPLRSFPITDDWTYARSVPRLLDLSYVPDQAAQASALVHIAWGALFAELFGQSFTVLTVANLFMGLVGVFAFYLLLRQLAVAPRYALLGAGLLGLNPIYVYLSYSFMTDVTFVVCILLGCLCYVKAAQGYGDRWLWLGSVAAASAYLTRQYGILLVPAALLYLWWSRDWLWRKAIAIALIPALVVVVYTLFERAQPTTLASIVASDVVSYIVQHPLAFAVARMQHDAWLTYAVGLFLLPVLKLPRRRLLTLAVFGVLITFIIFTLSLYGSAFPPAGNVIDHTGFVMYDYPAATLWSEGIWVVLAIIGALSFSIYAVATGEDVWLWISSGGLRSRTRNPVLVVYLVGIMLAALILVITPYVFDRYALTLLPILLVPELRRMSTGEKKPGLTWRVALVVPIALFAVLGQRDYMAHATVRWQAAEALAAQGIARDKIDAGFEWAQWYVFDEGLSYMQKTGDYTNAGYAAKAVLDPQYIVSDVPLPQYDEISSLPYVSWLSGGETRYVRILKRR